MESKEIRGLMEAYASIYEDYGKGKKGKKKMHDCATHVEHSEYGQGLCIKEQHTMLEDGTVTHYDVEFGVGIVENVPVTELRILASEAHAHEENEVKNAEVLDEEPRGLPYGPVGSGFKKLPAGPKREKMMKNEKKYTKAAMKDADEEGEAVGSNREKMGRISSALRNPRLREETEIFDYILEHLVAEGYADTNKAALAIMSNMSEEWKQSIVEAAADQSNKQIEKGVKTTYKAGNVLDNLHQGRSKGLNRLPAGERKAKTERMRGRLKARRDDLFGERRNREDAAREEMKKKYGL